jgi:hypothetical protein
LTTLRRFAAIALCVYSAAVTSNPVQSPLLPDVPPAGSRLDVLDRSIYRCEQRDDSIHCRRPGGAADHVVGEPAIGVVLVYRQDVLVRAVATFDEQRFNAVADKLSRSLGRTARESEDLNAGMGGTFENNYYIWRDDGRVWMLEQFFERITHSGLWSMDSNEFDALMDERERRRVRGVRDL